MKNTFLLALLILFSGIVSAQQKTTLDPKTLNPAIVKYTEKNYKDYKIEEAYRYDLVYEMLVKKEQAGESLVFDRNGKFLYVKTRADVGKTALQTRTSMPVKEVPAAIQEYVAKNKEGFKISEAYFFDDVYTTRAVKDTAAVNLVFASDGSFIMVKKGMPTVPPASTQGNVAPAKDVPPVPPVPESRKK